MCVCVFFFPVIVNHKILVLLLVTPQKRVSAGQSLRVYGVLGLKLWCYMRPVCNVPLVILNRRVILRLPL